MEMRHLMVSKKHSAYNHFKCLKIFKSFLYRFTIVTDYILISKKFLHCIKNHNENVPSKFLI